MGEPINLPPGKYRAPPEKGQPIFKRGGLLLLATVVVVVLTVALFNGAVTNLVRIAVCSITAC